MYLTGFAADPVLLTTALAGENVSLHCTLDNQSLNITQIEWSRKEEFIDHKIIIYHPNFGVYRFWANVTVEAVEDQGGRLRGAPLHRTGVKIWDTGL